MKIVQIQRTEKFPFYLIFQVIMVFFYTYALTRITTTPEIMYISYGLLILCILFIIKSGYTEFYKRKKGFICEIQINDTEICFVYFIQNSKNPCTFNFSHIKSFKMNINTNLNYMFNRAYLNNHSSMVINFEIETVYKNHKILLQPQTDYDAYNIIYSILDFSNNIPNFTYEVFGNNKKNTDEALKYYIDTK